MFNDYFAEVRNYLNGIPVRDQQEMVQFYEEQALDADWTVDQMVEKYGTPKQLARSLRLEYAMDVDDRQVGLGETEHPQSKSKNRTQMIWLIVLALLASPILFLLAIILVPMIIGILVGFVSLIVGIYVAVIGVLAGGIAAIIAGISVWSSSTATGIFLMGAGVLLTGLVVIFAPIVWNVTKWLFEMFIKFMKWIGRKLVSRRQNSQVKEG